MKKKMISGDHVVVDYPTEDFVAECCGCGLTHRFRFDVRGKKLLIIVEVVKKRVKK
jgi:hypothetical protein